MQLQSFSEEETAAAAFGVFLAGRRASAGSRRWKIREENWGKPEQPGGEWTNLLAETLRSNWSSSCPTRTHESTISRIHESNEFAETNAPKTFAMPTALTHYPPGGFKLAKRKKTRKLSTEIRRVLLPRAFTLSGCYCWGLCVLRWAGISFQLII